MPVWKKNIFVNAIRIKMKQDGRTAEEVILDYPKLTDSEKQEILLSI